MTLIVQVNKAIKILKNYKSRPLIYSIPDIEKHVNVYKSTYQPRCSLCKYLLVACNDCVSKTEHYSLLNKLKNYCVKKQKTVKLINTWITSIGQYIFIEISGNKTIDMDINTEILKWKSLNGDGTIVDFLYFLSPNKKLYTEVVAMVNDFISHEPDKNDLACFIEWLYEEKSDYAKDTYIGYLNEWVKALLSDRELCNFYDSLKRKNYDDIKLTSLLTSPRNIDKILITDGHKEALKPIMDDNNIDMLLIVKL